MRRGVSTRLSSSRFRSCRFTSLPFFLSFFLFNVTILNGSFLDTRAPLLELLDGRESSETLRSTRRLSRRSIAAQEDPSSSPLPWISFSCSGRPERPAFQRSPSLGSAAGNLNRYPPVENCRPEIVPFSLPSPANHHPTTSMIRTTAPFSTSRFFPQPTLILRGVRRHASAAAAQSELDSPPANLVELNPPTS